jgi:glycosyltransferase involved in cell wall biosynthesis
VTESSLRASRLHVLYVVYWGVAEPLGQSLVIPTVSKLALLGVRISLVTYEKPRDLARAGAMRDIRVRFEREGIRWVPLRYHKWPKVPATAFDVAHGVMKAIWVRDRAPVDLVHARTFVAGPIGLVAARALGVPFVYHNEGFYPDEQVDSGILRKGSFAHRAGVAIEGSLYDHSDGIITLSERARAVVVRRTAVARRGTPVVVVPSVVDLDRFRPSTAPPRSDGLLRLVYVGGVGGRYRLDALARFVAVVSELWPRVRLRVVTQEDPILVAEMMSRGGLPPEYWSVARVLHPQVPEELSVQDVGLIFLKEGLSEHAGSPTKVGEYWACGLPVVSTHNVSDIESIIRAERVGVVVEEQSDAGYRKVGEELRALLQDPYLRQRCRRAAEEHYALVPAVRRQFSLYRQLVDDRRGNA